MALGFLTGGVLSCMLGRIPLLVFAIRGWVSDIEPEVREKCP